MTELPLDMLWEIYNKTNAITQLRMHKAFPTKFPEPFIFPIIKKIGLYETVKHKTSIWLDITPTKHYRIFIYGTGMPFDTRTHVILEDGNDILGVWFSDDTYINGKSHKYKKGTVYDELKPSLSKYIIF
jgi:hypothetical protein